MRTAFFTALAEAAERDPRVNLVVGDLGFGAVEAFRARFPDRFLNAGVAEQNMTSLAAGMALEGKIVFTYSIANFPLLRCLEQLRNDACYHHADVKVVAVGGGFSYGALGMSHHATEDLAIARALPELCVVAPADPVETAALTRAIVAHPGPVYLRLGRTGEPVFHRRPIAVELGKAITVREGADVTLIATGTILGATLELADRLAEEGFAARVLSMHTLKPLDAEAVVAAARETRAIVTIEEHSVLGGLGGAVAEIVAELDGPRAVFRRIGLPSAFSPEIGSQEHLRAVHGLTSAAMARTLKPLLDLLRG